MRLTRSLMFYVKKKRIPGRLDSGKHQLVKPVTPAKKLVAAKQLILEQENLDVLEHAWLSEGEELSYVKHREELRLPEIEREAEINEVRAERMFKHKRMDDFLNHLNSTKQWE